MIEVATHTLQAIVIGITGIIIIGLPSALILSYIRNFRHRRVLRKTLRAAQEKPLPYGTDLDKLIITRATEYRHDFDR